MLSITVDTILGYTGVTLFLWNLQLPSITVDTVLGYIGVTLFLGGFFLILAGLEIIKVEKFIIVVAPKTWITGIILVVFGILFLFPDIRDVFFPQPSSEEIVIALENQDCKAQDYYVDDKLVGTVDADSTMTFRTNVGEHWVRACQAGTKSCGDLNKVTWTSYQRRYIYRSPSCPLTITLINEHCQAQDYYIDEKLVASVDAEATTEFEILPGEYSVKACLAGTEACGENNEVNWSAPTTRYIYSSANCE